MAGVLADTARRGVIVVVETHSLLLLRGIQTLVARGEIDSKNVMLHWFARDLEYGMTTVRSTNLDPNGAYGDWPEDFDDTSLETEKEYLDAVEERRISV
jgi:predicted ATPase